MKKLAITCLILLIALAFANAAFAVVEPRGYVKGEGYQYYEIGTYPQGSDGEVQPLLWRALSVEDGEALFLTEYVIDAQQVIFEKDETVIAEHSYRRIESFAQSDLCTWMNSVMLRTIMGDTGLDAALIEGEFGKLYPLTDDQLLMPQYGFSTARFGDVSVRRAKVTDYARSVGVYGDSTGAAPYWVATVKAAEGYKLQIVGFNGHLSYGAYTRTNIGVRPAMVLDLSRCIFTGGDGSKEQPFRIALSEAAVTAAPAGQSTLQPLGVTGSTRPATQNDAVNTAAGTQNWSQPMATAQPEPTLLAATATPIPHATVPANTDKEPTGSANEAVKLSLIGDCSIGDGYRSRNASNSLTSVIAKNGTAWPFSLIADHLTTDDLTAANLEVCLTASEKATDKMYPLIAPPENVAVLKSGGVEVVNTVNNHCFDFGTSGYTDTLATLEGADIRHFGSAILGGKLVSDITTVTEVKGIRFGFIGFSYPQNDTLEQIGERIQTLRAQGCDVVIVSLHWGRETYTSPKAGQPSYAAKIIDMGADVVWGHHPHVLQPVQFYKGKPVLFSTGNFIFGTMGPVDPSTGIFQLEYRKTESSVVLRRFSVVPCVTQGKGDYRPYELTGDAQRQGVWGMLRANRAYDGYENLPESFLQTGIVDFDDNGVMVNNQ